MGACVRTSDDGRVTPADVVQRSRQVRERLAWAQGLGYGPHQESPDLRPATTGAPVEVNQSVPGCMWGST